VNIDAKSIKIIKSRHWRNGWIEPHNRALTEADRTHLAEANWDLSSIQMTHDELVRDIIEMSQEVSLESCASLLSKSLSSRTVQDRSFLSSALQAMTIPIHNHSSDGRCPVCGLYPVTTLSQDVMLFEKIMWGGVRLTDVSYVWLDLKFLLNDRKQQTGTDELQELLDAIATSPGGLSASRFCASLKSVKGNKAEREVLCGILGVCDILQHPDHPGFLNRYPLAVDREMPNQHFIDLVWPFCWYNSDYGINQDSVDKIMLTGANKPFERTRLPRVGQL